MPIETHRSPDGLLTFIVEAVGAGDLALGFGYEWHTHPDLLVGTWGNTQAEAARAFIDDVLNNTLVILVRRKDGEIIDAMISDDPEFDANLCEVSEMLEMRYWDGRPWIPKVKI